MGGHDVEGDARLATSCLRERDHPRPRLLFLSPCTPDLKGTGWEQRAYAFLKAYSRCADVDLWFMPTADNRDLVRIGALPALCRSITAFYPAVFNDERSGFREKLAGHLSQAAVVHLLRMQELAAGLSHPRIVWDIDELPWSVRTAERNGGLGPTPGAMHEQARATFAQAAQKCRVVFGCSRLEEPPGCARYVVVPNVVAAAAGVEAPPAALPPRLLFVGNFNFQPNSDALAFFRDAVLPVLDRTAPGAEVLAVGRSPVAEDARASMARLQRDGRLSFAFDVPDCAPYYAGAAACIVPLRFGGGTRVKIIEAFAHRCAVVSTAKGCEGLEVEDGVHLRVADGPHDFAQACAELLRDAPLRRRLADNAFEFVRREHAQEAVDRTIASVVAGLVEQRR
jgi:glycosyltransferase involved in cell wall biosynthesis